MSAEQTTAPETSAPIPTEHEVLRDNYLRRGYPIATADRLARDEIAARETADANAEAAKVNQPTEQSLDPIPGNPEAVVQPARKRK